MNKISGRGRPRQFDEQEVLHKAGLIFLQEGFESASYEMIAEKLKLSKPSIYNAFGDKTALFEKALSNYADQAAHEINESFSNQASYADAALSLFTSAAHFYSQGQSHSLGCLLVGTALPATTQNVQVQSTLKRFTSSLESSIQSLIEEQYMRGLKATGTTPKAAALHIVSLIFALAVRARMGQSKRALTNTAREFKQLVARE